jgi:hypothetical protein
MEMWLILAALFGGMVLWISSLFILAKLRPEGYKYSDIFGPRMYVRYWQIAPERGWSRIPVCMLPIGAVSSGVLFILSISKFTTAP